MNEVKIRYREVIATKPAYGRFGEYQVVQARKILFRADIKAQAERWCEENNYTVAPAKRGTL